MECHAESPRLTVETDSTIYEVEFGQVQIEVTGRCNMLCQHCRAENEPRVDMSISEIAKVLEFARRFSPNHKEVIISGGEPLLRKDFGLMLEAVKANGGEFITLTTNGSVITKDHLTAIRNLKFSRFILSVSLDSLNPDEHDQFRRFRGAYNKAIEAIRMIVEADIPNVVASVRTTLRPHQLDQMEAVVEFVHSLGCKRSSLSPIHPAGRSVNRPELWMTRLQKKQFMETLYRLKAAFLDMQVTTSDPLKCILRGYSDIGTDNEIVFDGCTAAALTFNVGAGGLMTPCALLDIPMMNVKGMSIEEMTERYRTNPVVKNMLDLNLKGKCGKCDIKYQCGGCRARALIHTGDYLGEDPDCWR